MTLYFIDTENLGGMWITYAEKKYREEADCKILAFVTEKSVALSWEAFEVFRHFNSKRFEICHAKNGEKNALDFCLVARLGEEIIKSKKHKFVVVSKDKGFNAAIEYLNSRHGNLIARTDGTDIDIPSDKVVNVQRRDQLANLCNVPHSMAENLRVRLFAEKEDFAPYLNSLEYTVNWIQTSKSKSFKSNPELRKKLTDILKQEYIHIMQL